VWSPTSLPHDLRVGDVRAHAPVLEYLDEIGAIITAGGDGRGCTVLIRFEVANFRSVLDPESDAGFARRETAVAGERAESVARWTSGRVNA
jgi:hypothetical protein